MRPSESMTAEMPVLATRTSGTRFSTARSVACARCWYGADVRPNHASLVTFTRKSAPRATKRRGGAGKMSSLEMRAPQRPPGHGETSGSTPATTSAAAAPRGRAQKTGAAVREAGGTAAAREWHDGHEERQQHERGDEAPEPRPALGDHRQRHDVEQHDNRRDAVHAGHLGELREVVVPILAIAERRPRKA